MKYPVSIEGKLSADGHPLALATPSCLVIESAELLRAGSRVLDVGAYNGTNGLYLANMGHTVVSVEKHLPYILDGQQLAAKIGARALGNSFVHSDFRRYRSSESFDAAISTNVFQALDKQDAYTALERLKNFVEPNGLNVVSVYIGTPEQQAEIPSLSLFEPEELRELYSKSNWDIVNYRERMEPIRLAINKANGRKEPLVGSTAELIGRKQPAATLKETYEKQAAAIQKINPEYAKFLRSQANQMDS